MTKQTLTLVVCLLAMIPIAAESAAQNGPDPVALRRVADAALSRQFRDHAFRIAAVAIVVGDELVFKKGYGVDPATHGDQSRHQYLSGRIGFEGVCQ
jgi:CubicO group peptidase (beta-lactamase class C family)